MTAIPFSLGKIVVTSNCLEWAQRNDVNLLNYLTRHANNDWGDIDKEDWEQNDRALKYANDRIFSAYETGQGRIWIITEWNGESTCIMLPEDY